MPKRTIATGAECFTKNLRLPLGFKPTLKEMALKDCRSVNQEIIYILMKSIDEYLNQKRTGTNKDAPSK